MANTKMVEVTSEIVGRLVDMTNCLPYWLIAHHIHLNPPPDMQISPAPPFVLSLHVEIRLLLGLEVVEEDGALLGLLTPVLDDDARAVDNLASVALTVENA